MEFLRRVFPFLSVVRRVLDGRCGGGHYRIVRIDSASDPGVAHGIGNYGIPIQQGK